MCYIIRPEKEAQLSIQVLCESNNKKSLDVWSVSPAPGLQRPVASHNLGCYSSDDTGSDWKLAMVEDEFL